MKKLTAILLTILLLIPVTWAQERAIKPVKATAAKQALVIGNANYAYAGRLRNPVNDARAIGRTLEELGFKVTTVTDGDKRRMDQAIRRFGKDLQGSNGVGLFYYAGHGMQIEGENYLLPTDINPSNEFDVTYDAVPVGKLLGQMEVAENGMNVVILDACRNNPFARSFRSNSRGLAQVIAPTGTFISYATAPGSIAADGEGENGLFTEKLLKHMTTPGLTLERVFKQVRVDVQRESNNQQVPWDSSSLIGDFFFVSENRDQFSETVSVSKKKPSTAQSTQKDNQIMQKAPTVLEFSLEGEAALSELKNYNRCKNCDLRGVFLNNAELGRAELRGADLRKSSLYRAKLYDAKLEGANLEGADLRHIKLYGADLGASILRGVNLYGADLGGANLEGADLTKANLSGADLSGANLRNAQVKGAKLYSARFCYTTMPDGSIKDGGCY